MQTFNFFENQFVDVADMMALQSVPQSAIKDILVSLVDKGVITGVGIYPTSPTASLAVSIQAGKLILEDGSDIITGSAVLLNLASFVSALTTGQSVKVGIWAVPTQVSDTPVLTPSGVTINYRAYDSVLYVPVAAPAYTGADPGVVPLPPVGYTGVLIGYITLTFGQTAIVAGDIDQTVMKSFVNIPYILGLISANAPPFPISAITGLSAALALLMPLTYAIPESQVVNLTSDLATLTSALAALNTLLTSSVATMNASIAALAGTVTALGALESTDAANIATLTTAEATDATNIAALQAFEAGFTSGSSGGMWWKKHADGFIEQWGVAGGSNPLTVTFPIDFANIPNVTLTSNNFGTGATRNVAYLTASPTIHGFTASTDSSSIAVSWKACGY